MFFCPLRLAVFKIEMFLAAFVIFKYPVEQFFKYVQGKTSSEFML